MNALITISSFIVGIAIGFAIGVGAAFVIMHLLWSFYACDLVGTCGGILAFIVISAAIGGGMFGILYADRIRRID
jgi:hypothetical protein